MTRKLRMFEVAPGKSLKLAALTFTLGGGLILLVIYIVNS
jgi:hypothetical protein